MTTDNRTNEPTPEQVEAAAKALRADSMLCHTNGSAVPFEELARTALVAGGTRAMNEYTPTVNAVREAYAGDRYPNVRIVPAYEEFDRMISEVRREAAEKALTEFADEEELEFNCLLASMPDVFSGLSKERHQKREEAWERRRSAIRARARAEAYRQERKEQ